MEANNMRRTLILFIFIFSLSANSAIKKSVDELSKYRTEILQLGARLSSLEKEIGSKNNIYLSGIGQIRQFEQEVKVYKYALTKKQREVKQAQLENKKILQNYLLESENESTEPWHRKVHLELLKKSITKLSSKDEELKSFELKITEFDQKLSVLKKNEEELVQVIKELEERKKIAMEKYLSKVESKKKFESKLQSMKVHQKISSVKKSLIDKPVVLQRPDRLFLKPVEDFISMIPSSKGVTFKYQSVQPVKAVGSGKVVFAGDLSAYGQVVLVDHGNDLRTVLLGRLNIRVKKNDNVNDGDILAYTTNDIKEAQNLYFEVRKKNTAQNTILWLEQGGVSKI